MSFNVINLKHRDAQEVWLHLKDEQGNLAYADEGKKQPVRVKFKSVHGDAFRKSFFKMNVKLAKLKDGKAKEYEELAKQETGLTPEQVESDLVNIFMQGEDLAIDFICELAVDWEGFKDQDGKDLEFKPEYLQYFISQAANYSVFQQIRDSFKDSEAFTQA